MLQHEEWYQRYECLKEKQREAIKEWKASRNSNVPKDNTVSEVTNIQPKKVGSNEDIEKKKQKILEWKVISIKLYP